MPFSRVRRMREIAASWEISFRLYFRLQRKKETEGEGEDKEEEKEREGCFFEKEKMQQTEGPIGWHTSRAPRWRW